MGAAAIADPDVRAVFEAYPPTLREPLLALCRLILETAAETPGVGPVTEALRWKQPSYLTLASGAGSTIRIDAVKGSADRYALYVNCKTSLVESYRRLYPDAFRYEGRRALIFSTKAAPAAEALRHCIALALTYHRARTAAA